MILHIVSESPFAHDCLEQCLACMGERDGLLLVNEGVYALASEERCQAIKTLGDRCFALEQDVVARGLSTDSVPNLQLVDYPQWVDLVVRYEKSVSWYA